MQVEIIDPQGNVSYRRPHDHPDVLEAFKTPGYSVRGSEPAQPCSRAADGSVGACGHCINWEIPEQNGMKRRPGYGFCTMFTKETSRNHGDKCTAFEPWPD